ncbi:MAG TPA: SufE family protein [Bacteroidales bacterium]|jgi:cysteine desulfuration protein SufE|nr:SufE family protein [Bacteroidales bacterium]MDI9532327.1 SufE family protein [Bacteroidota bacterium]MBP7035302.1 SufE family protein [Bacteroidales bacterium]MBP8708491.1 SufE family protein [Bacteroidales bacterium]MZQ79205.1 SufE family protein [Bacteroidales bacterium]
MNINEIQDQIIDEFGQFGDWMERYEYLIDLGRSLGPFDERHKTPEYLIEGCQSKVWLYPSFENGIITFSAESDALITRGIVALLIRVFSGHTPAEIVDANIYFIEKIGLRENLSPTRSNGLLAMVKQMRLYALAYKAKQEHS